MLLLPGVSFRHCPSALQSVCIIFSNVFALTNCVTLEPHLPHVLIENGDMTQEDYDEYLHGRSDFIKATKKDSSNERKVSVPELTTTSYQYHFMENGKDHTIAQYHEQYYFCGAAVILSHYFVISCNIMQSNPMIRQPLVPKLLQV